MELRSTEYGVVDRTAVITLSRPHRGNAWTGRMHAEYKHCVARAENDPAVRVIVVTGSGNAFCVGGDSEALEGHAERGSYDDGLAAAGDASATTGQDGNGEGDSDSDGNGQGDGPAPKQAGYGLHPEFDHQFSFHFGLTKPVIAAINGPAAGVGLALACYADLRFARPGAKLTTAHGKLNLPPEFGLSWMLPRHLGLTRAMDLLLTSRVFLTDEAYELGLINQMHPADELVPKTLEYAEMLASSVSAGSLTASRQQAYLDQHRGVGTSVEQSLELLTDMMGHPDYRKGVKALQSKQPPDFQ
ncbi:MAG: enoyl-CoA hydratase-related protein [Acidimicrobiales bacterium]